MRWLASTIGSLPVWLLLAGIAAAASPDQIRRDARRLEEQGRSEEAIAAWEALTRAAPEDGDAYEQLGRLQLNHGQAEAAVHTFQRLLVRVPDHPRVYLHLGQALRQAGQLDRAQKAYRHHLTAHPKDADGHYGLAETLSAAGDVAGAIGSFEAYVALERRPEEAHWIGQAREQIAALEAQLGVPEPAAGPTPIATPAPIATPPPIATPAPAPIATPEGASAEEADEALAQGRYAEAREALQALARIRPDAVTVRYRLAVASTLTGDAIAGERHAAHAARLDPANPAATELALLLRARRTPGDERGGPPTEGEARLAFREGRLRTAAWLAAEALRGATDLDERIRLHRLRGAALLATQRYADARRALKRAAVLGGAPADLWLALGDAASGEIDVPTARHFYELALALERDDALQAAARARLAQLPRERGRR